MIAPKEISISTNTFVRAALVTVGVILIFLIRDMILILLVAMALASAINPIIEFFERFNFPRLVATGLVYALGIILISLFFYFFVPVIVNEVSSFLTALPKYSSELFSNGFGSRSEDIRNFLDNVATNAKTTVATFAEGTLGTVGVVSGGVFNFSLITALSFFFSVQKNGVAKFIVDIVPIKYSGYVLKIWERSQDKINKWLRGITLSSIVLGVTIYIGLLLLHIPHAFFFALLSAILNLIPIIGQTLATISVTAFAVAGGGLFLGALTAAFLVCVQLLEGNVLYPHIVGRAVGISPIAIILAIGIGMKLAGFLGILLAVPMSAVFMELVCDLRVKNKLDEKKEEHKNEKDPQTSI